MVLPCLDVVALGDIRDDGLRDDAQDGQRHADEHADDEAVDLVRDEGDLTRKRGDEERQAEQREAPDQQLLLAESPGQHVDDRIADERDERHEDEQDHVVVQFQQHFDVIDEARVEDRDADPVDDVGQDEDAEMMIAERLGQRLERVLLHGRRIVVFLFVDQESRQQHADERDQRQNAQRQAGADVIVPSGRSVDRLPDHLTAERDAGTDDVRQRDVGGDVHAVLLASAQHRDQGVVGRAVGRHEDVEQDERDRKPDDVDRGLPSDGAAEDQHGDERERKRGIPQERDALAQFAAAVIGHIGDPGVRDRVHETAAGGDDADDGQSDERRAGNERDDAVAGRIRQIEIDEQVGDDAGKDGPSQLADGKDPFGLCRYAFHNTVLLCAVNTHIYSCS